MLLSSVQKVNFSPHFPYINIIAVLFNKFFHTICQLFTPRIVIFFSLSDSMRHSIIPSELHYTWWRVFFFLMLFFFLKNENDTCCFSFLLNDRKKWWCISWYKHRIVTKLCSASFYWLIVKILIKTGFLEMYLKIFHGVIESFALKGIFKGHLVQTPAMKRNIYI